METVKAKDIEKMVAMVNAAVPTNESGIVKFFRSLLPQLPNLLRLALPRVKLNDRARRILTEARDVINAFLDGEPLEEI